MSNEASARFGRISAEELRRRLGSERAPLLLDVRRGEAFAERPGIPSAIPFALDRDPIRIPDVARERPVSLYCL
jgi:hypothetical protein